MADLTLPQSSSRRFSKLMLIVNGALAWGAVYLGLWHGGADGVVNSALGLIGVLYGAYTGVGHLDFRRAIGLAQTAMASQGAPTNDAQ